MDCYPRRFALRAPATDFYVRQEKMKNLYLILIILVTIAGCINKEAIENKICAKWIQEESKISCTTEFKKDGTIFVDYENGTDLEGSWKKISENKVQVKIKNWNIIGHFEEEKLILIKGNRKVVYKRIR